MTIHTKKKIDWTDVIRPENSGSYALGLGTEIAFELFRWMVSKAIAVHGQSGAIELLCGKPSCINTSYVDGFCGSDFHEDLHRRFQYAVLYGHPSRLQTEWRRECGIGWGLTTIAPIRYSTGHLTGNNCYPRDPDATLRRLLSMRGETIGIQLNPYHPDANMVGDVAIFAHGNGWRLRMMYGYPEDVLHAKRRIGAPSRLGGWSRDWHQETGELFYAFVLRCAEAIDALIVPACAPTQEVIP